MLATSHAFLCWKSPGHADGFAAALPIMKLFSIALYVYNTAARSPLPLRLPVLHRDCVTMKLIVLLAVLNQALYVTAQSFLEATGAYSQLSSFHQLLLANSTIAAGVLSNATTTGHNGTNITMQTILVPSNDAFTNYERANGHPVTSLSSSDLTNLGQYHSLQGALSSSDLQKPQGLISNTALNDQRYDNRELGSDGAQQPQVVYIGSTSTNGMVARQAGGANGAGGFVESGLGAKVDVDLVDGKFDGGMFQIVDEYVIHSIYLRTLAVRAVRHVVCAKTAVVTTAHQHTLLEFFTLNNLHQHSSSFPQRDGDEPSQHVPIPRLALPYSQKPFLTNLTASSPSPSTQPTQ